MGIDQATASVRSYLATSLSYLKTVRTKGSFAESTSYSFLGYIIMFSIQILSAPLTSRLYSPASYGTFSAILAIATNIAVLSSLRLENVIFILKTESERKVILKYLSTGALVISVVIFVVLLIIYNSSVISIEVLKSPLIFFVPVLIFTQVVFNLTSNQVVQKKEFKRAVIWGTTSALSSKFYALGYGYLNRNNPFGLLFSELLLKIFYIVTRIKFIIKNKFSDYLVTTKEEVLYGTKIVIEYRRFPLYELPLTYLNVLASQAHIYILSFINQNVLVGLISMAFTILDAPARIFVYSIMPVFLQKTSEIMDDQAIMLDRLTKLLLFIATVSVLPFMIITFWGPHLFAWAFSTSWYKAGIFAAAFSVYYFLKTELEILDQVLSLQQKQKFLLSISIVFNIMKIASLLIFFVLVKDPMKAVVYWAFTLAAITILITFYYYRMLNIKSIYLFFIKIFFLIIAIYSFKHYINQI